MRRLWLRWEMGGRVHVSGIINYTHLIVSMGLNCRHRFSAQRCQRDVSCEKVWDSFHPDYYVMRAQQHEYGCHCVFIILISE